VPASSASRPTLAYLFQPGSFATLALFEAARELCNLVWVVDSTELDPVDRRLLDRTGTIVDIAGLHVDAAAARVGELRPSGILTLADDKLRAAAAIGERLDLPFHSPATAERLTDKLAQRQALGRAGMKTPRSAVVTPSGRGSLASSVAGLSFPAVLKPRLGEGSKDTISVSSIADLGAELTAMARTGDAERAFVVEEFIPDATTELGGEGFAGYVSVESYVLGSRITHLAVTGRMPPAHPFRETGFFVPSALSDALRADVERAAADAARAVGVEMGCLHTEVKLTDEGPVVIEVNGRVGGGVPEMLAASAGVRFLEVALTIAVGGDPRLDGRVRIDRLSYLFYVHAPIELHEVTLVEGLDAIRAIEGVEEVVLRRGPGARVDWRDGNHGHVASVFGVAHDHDELRRVYDLVTATIRIHGA
jgi:biotin carboxylase